MHKDMIFADTMQNYYATQNIQTKTREGEHTSPTAPQVLKYIHHGLPYLN